MVVSHSSRETLFTLSLLILYVSSQEITFGRCPLYPVETNFNPMKYSGLWYEYSSYFAFFQTNAKCVTAHYSLLKDYGPKTTLEVINRSLNKRTNKPDEIKGLGVVADPYDPTGSAELIVNFEGMPRFARSNRPNYNIISTDYHSYSIVYACRSIAFVRTEFMFILTREPLPDPYLIKRLYGQIRFLGLNTTRLKKIDQRRCPATGYGKSSNETEQFTEDDNLIKRQSLADQSFQIVHSKKRPSQAVSKPRTFWMFG